jgi:hypothetical protein
MTSHQLSELTPQELYDHTENVLTEAEEAMRRANLMVMWGPIEVPRNQDPPHPIQRAFELAIGARGLAQRALETRSPARAVLFRAQAIAYLDIIHRQQMMGEWPYETNQVAVDEAMNRAAKISKRRFRKNKTKTKRRRRRMHKNTKRRRP